MYCSLQRHEFKTEEAVAWAASLCMSIKGYGGNLPAAARQVCGCGVTYNENLVRSVPYDKKLAECFRK